VVQGSPMVGPQPAATRRTTARKERTAGTLRRAGASGNFPRAVGRTRAGVDLLGTGPSSRGFRFQP
jgi:hypothetical protein